MEITAVVLESRRDKLTNRREESPQTDPDVHFYLIYGKFNTAVPPKKDGQLNSNMEKKCMWPLPHTIQ